MQASTEPENALTCSCALHRGLVLQVAFSPRELKLVTAGDDSEVRIWDLTKKACVATLKVRHHVPTTCSHSVRSAAALVTMAILRDLCGNV